MISPLCDFYRLTQMKSNGELYRRSHPALWVWHCGWGEFGRSLCDLGYWPPAGLTSRSFSDPPPMSHRKAITTLYYSTGYVKAIETETIVSRNFFEGLAPLPFSWLPTLKSIYEISSPQMGLQTQQQQGLEMSRNQGGLPLPSFSTNVVWIRLFKLQCNILIIFPLLN